MPFDENGLWQDQITHEPQTGALAGLDILNQFQSQGNYQRSRAAQLLDHILKLRNQAGSDVSQTPEGGQAMETLGVQPSTVQDLYAKTPEAMFRSGVSVMPSPTAEDVTGLALKTGAMTAPQAVTGFNRNLRAQGDVEAKEATAKQKAYDRALTVAKNPQEAAEMTVALLKTEPWWKPEHEAPLRAWVAAQPEVTGGIVGSRMDLNAQHARLYEESRQHMMNMEPSQINKDNAMAEAAHARAAATGILAAVAQGNLAEKERSNLANEVVHNRQIVAGLAKAAAQIGVIPGAARPILDQAKLAQQDLDRAEQALALQISQPAVAAPATAAPTAKKSAPKTSAAPIGKAPAGTPDGPANLKDGTKVIIKDGLVYKAAA
jgi:hypothetical protein